MPTVAQLLQASGLPAREARALIAKHLATTREALVAHPEREVAQQDVHAIQLLIDRRRNGEPFAYLVGEREFYGRPFEVGPAVLIPRPETELLVRLALGVARSIPQAAVLDLGTGSGCIAITLALEAPHARVTATDISGAALAVARSNARKLGAPVAFTRSDWFAAVEGRFDLIVSNPPYVAQGDSHLDDLRFEPRAALTSGADGLSALRSIVAAAGGYLQPGGRLLLEHGYDQAARVRDLLRGHGFGDVETTRDEAGNERVTAARGA